MTDPRENKLPKWAQQELARLRRRNEELKRAVSELNGEVPAFGVIRGWSAEKDRPVMFDQYDTMTIMMGDQMYDPDGSFQRYVDIHRKDGLLQIRGSGQLSIRPNVSNSITIDVEN